MKQLLDFFSDHRNLSLLLAATGAVILGFVYTAQYGFGCEPCILCRYQRGPYYALLIFGLLGAGFARFNSKAGFGFLLLCGAAALTGLGISGYHIGVEHHWWMGPQACGGALPTTGTIEELRQYLLNRPIVDCSVPMCKIGLSMTGWNFILSLGLTGFISAMLLRGRKKS
ncbi:MAG: disulfide bond formation protein B [Alphaproteobacteria bacterium]|nr:disulfide bond formation protein B [Alphaproteobacteria bacterium]